MRCCVDRLIVFLAVGTFVLFTLANLSGLVAYAVYRDCDPLTSGRIQKPDQIMPYLVMDKLSHLPGVPGLFVAAVFGGVLRYLAHHSPQQKKKLLLSSCFV